MRKLKFVLMLGLFISAMISGCTEDTVGPYKGEGEENEEPIILDPPKEDNGIVYDSL